MKTFLLFLIMFPSVYFTYGQSGKNTIFTYSDFGTDSIALPQKYGIQHMNQNAPLLIPITGSQNNHRPDITIYGLKDSLNIIVSVDVCFDNDLTDTTKHIKPIYVSIRNIVFPNGKTLFNAENIDSCRDMYIWSRVNEVFINWMYQQPFDKYNNRKQRHPLHPELPITRLTLTYKLNLVP